LRDPEHYGVPSGAACAENLVALAGERARRQPAATAYLFLANGEEEQGALSYGELDLRARAIAGRLQDLAAPGRRALLLYPPGLAYIEAFFGCLYAGLVAVPAHPPSRRQGARLKAILADAAPALILTTADLAGQYGSKWAEDLVPAATAWLPTDTVASEWADLWVPPLLTPDSLAFLQYTSGSTGDPKGVMVGHGNLIANQEAIRRSFGHTEQSTVVGWLPLHHDMGLIGNVLQPLYVGATAVLMSPLAFLEKPVRWLRAISAYGAATSGGPNFAYELCVRKIAEEDKRGLDLSAWTLAFNGSEPVRAATLERFGAAFEPCGFRRDSFFPCYGLAEATLFVTGAKREASPDGQDADPVSCGHPWAGHEVRIVDPETQRSCPPGQVGEIWVAGPSVAQGYWNRPEESERVFRARLAEDGSPATPFLRTGDLGFLKAGRLCVTGRIKDLIILRGRNVYPQDIEHALTDRIGPLQPGGCVAFPIVRDDEEQLAVVAEVTRETLRRGDFEAVFAALRQVLAEDLELAAAELALVPPGTVPKTSSGKPRRSACKAAWQDGRLPVLAHAGSETTDAAPPATADVSASAGNGAPEALLREALSALPPDQRAPLLARFLRAQLARLLRTDPEHVSLETPLRSLGLDSLKTVELKHAVDGLLGGDAPLALFLAEVSVRELAEALGRAGFGPPEPVETGPTPTAADGAHGVPYGLSFPQRAMWTVQRMEPDGIGYNLHLALRLEGPLDADRLRRAFALLVERHDVLRTAYRSEGDEVRQEALPSAALPAYFSTVDAERWSEAELQADLARRVREPFDLATGPVFRAALYRHATDAHTLLLCAHHIALDLWSLLIVLAELKTAHAALEAGRAFRLPAPAADYRGFTARQAAYPESTNGERDWDYWRERLAGELPLLALPADHPRPKTSTDMGASRPLRLDLEETRRLKALAGAEGVTLFTLLLAAYKTLLHRCTGQDDVIVGVPSSGRGQSRYAGVVGNFVNPLPLRTHPTPERAFTAYLAEVRDALTGALEHQEFPFALLVERLQPERHAGHWPIYQTLFVLQQAQAGLGGEFAQLALGEDGPALDFGPWRARPLSIRQRVENFDLKLMAAESEGGLLFSFQYRSDLFEPNTVARLAGHFRNLLRGLAARPETPLGDLPLLSEAERDQIDAWNATAVDYPGPDRLHLLFENQVERTPDAPALLFGEECLSYRELNTSANRLAHALIAAGVRPDEPVGICAERSLEMVIGLLGILKAGGAYLPLDPEYPPDRLDAMLKDAGARCLLVQPRLAGRLPPFAGEVLPLTADAVAFWTPSPRPSPSGERELLTSSPRPSPSGERGFADAPTHNPAVAGAGDSLAYVLFTSGSTGRPKGVGVPHRGVCNRLLWMQDYFGLDAGDTVLQKTPYTFDVSVWEFFWPLLVGARLAMAEPGAHKEPERLIALIERHRVTTLHFVPSMLAAFLEAPDLGPCVGLRRVICSGEALGADLQRRCFERLGAGLYNLYGPTEASIDVTAWTCLRDDDSVSVPIGRPVANTRIHLLDARLNPVPVGVPGELYIGGVQLARGYVSRSDLTAERFVPDPEGPAGGRLYRTGDLARYRPHGNIEYLGRIDHQVKIRGFRIELGEIEAALRRHPAVQDVAVIAREDHPGDKRLAAYWVADAGGGAPPEGEDLARFLRSSLPDYMIPAAFVRMERLPVTANGKLDRKALPVPDFGGRFADRYVAPRDATEAVLARLFGEVLQVERVGIHDNFFGLGGDSISSIQVASRAHQAGLALTPRQLFEHQTVAELAAVAGHAATPSGDLGPVSGPAPLTPIQHWFFEQDFPNPHHWNQAVLLEVRAPLAPATAAEALKRLVDHHDALRLRFHREGGAWHQTGLAEEPHDFFQVLDLSGLSETEQAERIEAECGRCQASLNLTEGPLLGAVWFERGPGLAARLFIAIHHLAVDGVSWRILLEDLDTACRQIGRGEPVVLPAKTTAYKTWAERLPVLAQSEVLREDAAWWLETGAEASPLPLDDPEGSRAERHTAVAEFELDAAATRALLDAASAHRTDPSVLLLAALARTLGGWLRGDTVLIDLEGHGREDLFEGVDLSRTVGWFTSLYPVRLPVAADGAVEKVRDELRRLPRKGLSYGLLRYLAAGGTGEKLRSLPAAPILFNYLGRFEYGNAPLSPLGEGRGEGIQKRIFLPILPPTNSVENRDFEKNPGFDTLTLPLSQRREGTGAMTPGACHGPDNARTHELEINALLTAGRLRLEWRHSAARLRETTVADLAGRHLANLRELIAQGTAPPARLAPEDFPLARLSLEELAALPYDPSNIEDLYTLSPMQEGMLFDTLLAPRSGIYLMQDRFEIEGPVDPEVFRRAWQAIVDRHPALRTGFVFEGLSRPHQIVHRRVALPFEYLDWRDLPEPEQQARLDEILAGERERGFDFGNPPLMAIRLIRLGEDRYRFVRSYHHILVDAWCLSLILVELKATYDALLAGRTPTLAPAPGFRSYLEWLAKRDEAQAERFWRDYLRGFEEPTPLVVDKPAAAGRPGEEGVADAIAFLSEADTQSLNALAQRLRLTPNTFIQAAWALLLARYSGRREVLFGVTVAGRPADLPDGETVLGVFINSLPLRIAVPPEQPAVEFLRGLLARNLELRQHEETPLVRIQRWSELPREQALFESLLVFENYPIDPSLRRGEGALNLTGVETRTHTNVPLNGMVIPGERLHLQITYHRDRFEDAAVQRMLGHFKNLLENLIHRSGRRIGEMDLLDAAERHQLLYGWNRTGRRYAEPRDAVGCFEAHAERKPDAVVAVCGETRLTYAELNARANRLAHVLADSGVGTDTIVALLDDRGLDFLTMMLAVFKAGGAYLPLDPAHPDARLAQVLRESRVGRVLVGKPYLGRVAALRAHLGDSAPAFLPLAELARSSHRAHNPPRRHAAESLAFVIFTSGSTGTPKGAMVEHAGMYNNLVTKRPTLGLTSADVYAQTAGQCFDISVWQFLSAPVLGGRVEIFVDEVSRDPDRLLREVAARGVTVLEAVPSMIVALLDAASGSVELPALRWLIACGEAFPPDLCRRWLARFPHTRVLNAYGPAECSDDVSYYAVPEPPGEADAVVPVGRPADNVRLYLLDRRLEPVPVGVPGEICVAGVQVGRGYLHRPDLTAERFVPNPFVRLETGGRRPEEEEASQVSSLKSQALLYRTGDLGRYRPDGDIEFLGRVDHQVKVRGFRIEPGEIEAQLLKHPWVEQAAVLAHDGGRGGKRLAAYWAGRGAPADEAEANDELRAFLGERLPNYMVPALFVRLDALPLGVNGKIDRRALPKPDAAGSFEHRYVAPRNPTEEILVGIWREVLAVERVGVTDGFFDLGGHSLLAVQVLSRVRAAFGTDLPLRAVFESATVEDLALAVEEHLLAQLGEMTDEEALALLGNGG
jgi:amino acid adenylation domain-containing protein/non-ribosomal peptide synthase protein (TIGR01720 family)